MKKALSTLLSIVMVFSLALPAFALSSGSEYPIITISGNGEDILDPEGNVVYDFDYDTSNLANDVAEVCLPHLLTGLATGNFDDYYDALYKKLAEIYGTARFDENGDPIGGTDISPLRYEENEQYLNQAPKSIYTMDDYHWEYDWRLDPWILADRLDQFINTVLANTGKSKVSLQGSCLGGTPIMAYLAKYGNEKIDTVCLDAVVVNGCEMINDVFTGNMNFSGEAFLRFVDSDWRENITDIITDPLLFDLMCSTVRLLNAVGASQKVVDLFLDVVYKDFGKKVTGIFARAGIGTWPSYWSAVEVQNYEYAKTVVFGKEGSETRKTFAGLIAKLDNYYENVTTKIPEILKTTKESGTKVIIVAKYGTQLFPWYGSYNEISDQWVSVSNASMGATACLIGEKFSDQYIAKQEAAGLGRYICVDKTIDASTCVLPDNTWFVKTMNHDNWDRCIDRLEFEVCCGRITDIYSNPNYPQFLHYDRDTSTLSPLTEENMNCEDYFNSDTGSTSGMSKKDVIYKRLMVLFEFLDKFFQYIKSVFQAKQQPETAVIAWHR